MAKRKGKAVTPNRVDVTSRIYPGLTFEDDSLPVMDLDERKRRLSRFARENAYNKYGQPFRTSAIQAIQELNKVERVYTDYPGGLQDNRTYNIYIAGGESEKRRLELLMAGKLLHGGGKAQDVVAEEVTTPPDIGGKDV